MFNGESWGGVYLLMGQYDASKASVLSMRLKLPEEVARLELKLEGPETVAQSVNLIEYETHRDATGWRSFTVPLTEFDEIDLSQIAILGVWKPTNPHGRHVSGEVILDDVHFE